MIAPLACAVLTLLLLGWMLCINAKDRQILEKQLEDEFGDDSNA
jgi:hypothetical protein